MKKDKDRYYCALALANPISIRKKNHLRKKIKSELLKIELSSSNKIKKNEKNNSDK